MKRIVLMGPPGVGKGTQAERLSSTLGVPAISTGELFRHHVRTETGLGLRVQAIVEAGQYVPDELTNAMVTQRLGEEDAVGGFILDGYPRTIPQIEELDQIIFGQHLYAVILLDAPIPQIVGRLVLRADSLGRSDDTPAVIRSRIVTFNDTTRAVAQVYEERGILQKVDGTGEPDDVERLIRQALQLVH